MLYFCLLVGYRTPQLKTKFGEEMSDIFKLQIKDLRNLDYSPDENPLLNPSTIRVKKKHVSTNLTTRLVNPETGEVEALSKIHTIEEKDDEHFVKVFAAGVAASYDLTKTASRVFQAILAIYEKTPLSNGFADSVYIAWFGEGLSGHAIGMSEKTFKRGLKQLLEKGFISPKAPNMFWVNPALFFKGDRVAFIKEYKRKEIGDARKQQELLD